MTTVFEHPPREVGPFKPVDITGCGILMLANGQPFVLSMGGSEDLYVPIFSTQDHFDLFLEEFGHVVFDASCAPGGMLKCIVDGHEFLTSVPPGVRVMLDPRRKPSGAIGWTEVRLPPASPADPRDASR